SASTNETMKVTSCPAAFARDENLTFSCSGSPMSCSDSAFNVPRPDTNLGLTSGGTQQNFFVGMSILTSDIGAPDKPRKLAAAADVATYDSQRLKLSDLTDISATTATISTVAGAVATRDGSGWA